MKGRLNIFQRTMLDWNELHPYNAVHVARVSRTLDLNRLEHAIRTTLDDSGLARVTLNPSRGRFEYSGGSTNPNLKLIPAPANPLPALASEIERELNTRFDLRETFSPFRFAVFAAGDGFFLAVTYLHAIADGESIVRLLLEILLRYSEPGASGRAASTPAQIARRSRLLPLRPAFLARLLTSVPAQLGAVRSSCRAHYRDPRNFENGFRLVTMPPHTLPRLLQTARSLGVTLNDLFLALLMKALSPLAPNRFSATRRRRIALGSIVNIRGEMGAANRDAFGLFLGSFLVTHEAPDPLSAPDLARELHCQTRHLKERKLYCATPLHLAVARTLFQLFSTERRRTFYQKHHPLWGGITNMNLGSLPDATDIAKPTDYFRAVSTGPATPLVLSATTVGGHLNLSLTYRTTVYSAVEIERISGCLVDWEGQFPVRT